MTELAYASVIVWALNEWSTQVDSAGLWLTQEQRERSRQFFASIIRTSFARGVCNFGFSAVWACVVDSGCMLKHT